MRSSTQIKAQAEHTNAAPTLSFVLNNTQDKTLRQSRGNRTLKA